MPEPTSQAPDLPRSTRSWSAEQTLTWALTALGDRCPVVSALQLEGIVIVDIARRLGFRPQVITIDTGRLPQETHDFIDEVYRRFDVRVQMVSPDPVELGVLTRRHGSNLFREDPALRELCCHVRKVLPLRRALADSLGWISGIRRDGGPGRASARQVERDPDRPHLIKVNPLADWSRAQVWDYVRARDLPVHPLHSMGFPSIGCVPCTRAVSAGEPERAGRWWWEAERDAECGIHGGGQGRRFQTALADLLADADADAGIGPLAVAPTAHAQ